MSYESGYESPVEMFNLVEVPVEYVEDYTEYANLSQVEQVPIKADRASPYPSKAPSRRRPGKQPQRRDSELAPEELARVERRRERNRVAASRCRDRRLNKVNELEAQVKALKSSKEQLASENESLRKQVEALQLQIEAKNRASSGDISNKGEYQTVCGNIDFPAVEQLQQQFSFEGPLKSALLFTPGGRFTFTPLIRTDNVFEFPNITDQNEITASFTQTVET